MRRVQLVATMVMIAAFLVGSASAQKKTPKKPAPAAKPPVTVVPPLEVRAGREKVDNQLSNVNKFIDVLGPIAQSIELLDESSKTKKLPQDAIDKNEANKQKVIEAIRNLRAGLNGGNACER